MRFFSPFRYYFSPWQDPLLHSQVSITKKRSNQKYYQSDSLGKRECNLLLFICSIFSWGPLSCYCYCTTPSSSSALWSYLRTSSTSTKSIMVGDLFSIWWKGIVHTICHHGMYGKVLHIGHILVMTIQKQRGGYNLLATILGQITFSAILSKIVF